MVKKAIFVAISLFFIGCGESDGEMFHQSSFSTTSVCEDNISIRKNVDLLKKNDLVYESEKFHFSFDGVDDYDTTPAYKDSGTYDENTNSSDNSVKNFYITLKDSGDLSLSGDINGTIDFYCVDVSGDGKKDTTRIRFLGNYINKLLKLKAHQ